MDVVIVGGGIQGATMAWSAARRGLRPMIVERNRIGQGATGSSYGIVHGGLRYLQTLDLARWRRSKRAQHWFARHFPDRVKPLSCVMPLYAGCLRSPAAFRAAGLLEKALTAMAGDGIGTLAPLAILPPDRLSDLPIPAKGLTGAAVWQDMQVDDMPALLHDILHAAGVRPGQLREQSEAMRVVMDGGRVTGLELRDRKTGGPEVLPADMIVNCAGAWSAGLAPDRSPPAATLAFNLLLDVEVPWDCALAVSERAGRGRSYFLRPFDGGVLAGTYYRPSPGSRAPRVSSADIAAFRDILRSALPASDIADAPIRAIWSGLLPDRDGSGRRLDSRDHVIAGDGSGMVTVVGGKLTTAPLLSEDVAARLWPDLKVRG